MNATLTKTENSERYCSSLGGRSRPYPREDRRTPRHYPSHPQDRADYGPFYPRQGLEIGRGFIPRNNGKR
jgi:hypothetical protein